VLFRSCLNIAQGIEFIGGHESLDFLTALRTSEFAKVFATRSSPRREKLQNKVKFHKEFQFSN
jgi:hypothetical protein